MSAPNDIFIGNVSGNTTEDQLRETFCVVGAIKNIRILMDKDTGRPKGYASIEYQSQDSVNAAIRLLDKTELNGKQLKVSHAAGTGGPAQQKSTESTVNFAQQLPLHDAWDILNTFKEMVNNKSARLVVETYPQLVAGLTELEDRLGKYLVLSFASFFFSPFPLSITVIMTIVILI